MPNQSFSYPISIFYICNRFGYLSRKKTENNSIQKISFGKFNLPQIQTNSNQHKTFSNKVVSKLEKKTMQKKWTTKYFKKQSSNKYNYKEQKNKYRKNKMKAKPINPTFIPLFCFSVISFKKFFLYLPTLLQRQAHLSLSGICRLLYGAQVQSLKQCYKTFSFEQVVQIKGEYERGCGCFTGQERIKEMSYWRGII